MRIVLALILASCAPATAPVCVERVPTCDGDDWALCLVPDLPGSCVEERVTGAPTCADGTPMCRNPDAVPTCVHPDAIVCP